jgi:hypothetical protein
VQLAGYRFLGSRLLRLGGLRRVLWSVEQGRRSLACKTMSLGARVHFSREVIREFFSGGKYHLGTALTETVKLSQLSYHILIGRRELNVINMEIMAATASDHRYSFRQFTNSVT